MGGWGNKTEKLGRVYAVTYEGRPRQDPAAGQGLRPDRGPDPAARPSVVPRAAAGPDRPDPAGQGRARAGRRRAGEPEDRPGRQAAPGLGARRDRRRHARGDDPLIDALKSPVADVRAQAARALGERAVPIADEPLIALLKDREPAVRLQAVIALGRIGDRDAVPALLPVLADKDAFIAFSARQALRRIGDWQAAARGSTRPTPRSARASCWPWSRSTTPSALRPLRGSPSRPSATDRRAGQGGAIPGRGPPQGAALGRQVVGHAAGEARAARQDDRLGRDAAGARRRPPVAARPRRPRSGSPPSMRWPRRRTRSRARRSGRGSSARRMRRSAARSPWPSASWRIASRSTS